MKKSYQLPVTSYQLKRGGFTLIEVLVTITLVAVLGTVASSSLFSLMRGANKTETLKEVKQNGDYALSVMELKIRSALDVYNCDGATRNSLTILNHDGTQSTFQCVSGANTRRIQETITPSPPPSPSSNYLTNQSVSLVDCGTTYVSFICVLGADGTSKVVQIQFRLSQASSTAPTSEQTTQTFSTQVSVRN